MLGLLTGAPLTGLPSLAHAELEEIFVTARKREEALLEVPVAVTSLDGTNFMREGIVSLGQVDSRIPGLVLGRGAQTSTAYIRGIGSGINKAFEQSVGMFVDGIYQPRSRQLTQSLFDIYRVEVLRGPQTFLFGKNTTSGAIKVATMSPAPDEPFTGFVLLDYEPEYSTWRGSVVLSGAITENLAARVALRYQETDGYVDNLLRGQSEMQREDRLGRISLVYRASPSFDAEFKYATTKMEGSGAEVTNPVVNTDLLDGFLAGNSNLPLTSLIGTMAALATPGYGPSNGPNRLESWLGNLDWFNTDFEDTNSSQASLLMNWRLNDLTVTSLTGYSEFRFFQNHDVDLAPSNFIQNPSDQEKLDQLSQELRVASDREGRINFLGGLYFEKQELTPAGRPTLDGTLGGFFGTLPANAFNPMAPPDLTLSDLGIHSLWNGALLAPDTPLASIELDSIFRTHLFDQDAETISIFGEVSLAWTDAVDLDVGLRYSRDRKNVRKGVDLGVGDPSEPSVAISPDGQLTGTIGPLDSALLAAIFGASFNTFPHDQNLKRRESHLDPSIKLRWRIKQDTVLWVAYSTGYKSGGFNYTPDTANPDGSVGTGTEFEDEQATSLELGLRSLLLDGRALVGANVFHTRIDDLQVTTFQGATFQVGNAAETTVKGLELQGQMAITDQFVMGGELAWLDHRFDDYRNAPCTVYQLAGTAPGWNCVQDFSGRRGPYAPEWSFVLFADWSKTLSSGMELSMTADIGYKSKMFLDQDLDINTQQDAYYKINARISLASPGGAWELALYGRNLTDETTYSFMLDAPLAAGIYAGWNEEPRIVGAQFRYNF